MPSRRASWLPTELSTRKVSRWSARSEVRTNDLDADERRLKIRVEAKPKPLLLLHLRNVFDQ